VSHATPERLSRRTVGIKLPDAPVPRFTLSYDPSSEVQRSMYEDIESGRMYEPGTWQTLRAILRPGDKYVDVGAHVGTFACLAAALVGPSGWVTAFEPDKTNFRQLVANAHANNFTWLGEHQVAVNEHGGRIVFHRCADNDGGHAIYDPGRHRGNVATRRKPSRRIVPATTIDALDAGGRGARLIKIDVEGSEVAVLKGAQHYIAQWRPAIIAEQNPGGLHCMGTNERELRGLVSRHGYRTHAIQDSPPFLVPVADNETCRPEVVIDGARHLAIFNWCFLPNEWPSLIYPASLQSASASSSE
jgi:FkbM family methyltransferase